jgi:hypothetical protein
VLPRTAPSAAPGPTDLEVFACIVVPTIEWPTLESTLGAAGPNAELTIPETIGHLLFDSATLAGLPRIGAAVQVVGPAYSIRGVVRLPYRGDLAVRLGDQLVVRLWTE